MNKKYVLGLILVFCICLMPVTAALRVNGTSSTLSLVVDSSPSPIRGSRETYTMYGYLKNSAGAPIPNAGIDIWARYPSEQTGWLWKHVTTNSAGYFSITTSLVQSTCFRALYGDVRSGLLTVGIVTISLTLETHEITPPDSEYTIFTGVLTDTEGHRVPNRNVTLWFRAVDFQSSGHPIRNIPTDANGIYGRWIQHWGDPTHLRWRATYNMVNGHIAYSNYVDTY